ncbi:MAG: helix-turn-helix domain-containing protein [Kiritimatiellae bacterium]|nr:helix-turn-helix domain-containing protein [Kiritimatiellia bacterium]
MIFIRLSVNILTRQFNFGGVLDLRERVVAYVQAGGKKVEACHIFQVGHDTLYRWLRQHREEGSLHPCKRGKYKVRKIDDQALPYFSQGKLSLWACSAL